MPEMQWTIARDFAEELCPGDEQAGLAQIAVMLGGAECWIDEHHRKLERAAILTGASVVASCGAIIASQLGGYNPAWASPVFSAFSFAAFGLTLGLPYLAQQLPINWVDRRPFNAERLRPIFVYLERCVEQRRKFVDQDGEEVATKFMLSPWAVLLFSNRLKIRALAIDGSKGAVQRRYPKGLFIQKRAVRAMVTIPPEERSNISVFVDQRTTMNIDQRTANVFVVERSEPPASPNESAPATKAKPPKPRHTNHWLFGISHAHFLWISEQIVGRYDLIPGGQVRIMLDVAYGAFNENPHWDVTKVRNLVCHALTEAGLPINLGKTKKNASEWIDRMLARSGDKHRYHYVRRMMTEPDFVPRNGTRSQPDFFASPD